MVVVGDNVTQYGELENYLISSSLQSGDRTLQ
jgi:hypothetical protein